MTPEVLAENWGLGNRMEGRTLTHAPSAGASAPPSKELEEKARDVTGLKDCGKVQTQLYVQPNMNPAHITRADRLPF